MDKEWSEKNKKMQTLISKEATFSEGINLLLELRGNLFEQISSIIKTFPPEAFYQMPFGDGDKNHNSTLAWSLWHLFRIEDIVAHTLILNNRQILFESNWIEKINSPIITTGNELDGEAMVEFSKKLNVKALYEYCKAVMDSTNELLKSLQFSDLKRKFSCADKERLIAGKCVSDSDSASWLIDFWCGKNVKGLIQMPFSRHWIMHVEAMWRIKNKLCQEEKMKAFIVYCHPSEDSFTRHVRDSFIKGIEDSGNDYVLSDLYKMNFKTDMSEQEYLRDANYRKLPEVAEDVAAEQSKINSSDAIVFIYPVFWTEAPAKLVGWFDRVWSHGFAYGENRTMKVLDQALFLVTAGNTMERLEKFGLLDSMKKVMIGDRIFDRAKKSDFVIFPGMSRELASREEGWGKNLKTAYEKGANLFK